MSDNATPNTPEEPKVIRVDPEINNKLNGFRAAVNTIQAEIGGLEIRKYSLLGQLSDIQARAQSLLKHEAERLGIPEGQNWTVLPDGTVQTGPAAGRVVGQPPQPQQPPQG